MCSHVALNELQVCIGELEVSISTHGLGLILQRDGWREDTPTVMYSMQNKWETCCCSIVCSVDSFYLWLFCKLPALEEFARGCAAHASQDPELNFCLLRQKRPRREKQSMFLMHWFCRACLPGRLAWQKVIWTKSLWWVNKNHQLLFKAYAAYGKT